MRCRCAVAPCVCRLCTVTCVRTSASNKRSSVSPAASSPPPQRPRLSTPPPPTFSRSAVMQQLIDDQMNSGLKPPSGLEGLDSVTLTRFVLQGQRKHHEASGDLTLLLAAVQLACKVTETCVRRAGIAKLYGLAGSGNVQGEDQKKLDVIANDTFKVNINSSEKCGVMVSEEDDLAIVCQKSSIDGSTGKYAIAFDPLDGSSNIDANVSIGTIFSIFKLHNPDSIVDAESAAQGIMQPGREMVAAGYAMYGSATNLVISVGTGVHGFTLDPSLGEFVLTHPDIKIPTRGKIYSVNEGNAKNWDKATSEYIQSLKYPEEGKSSYSLRYIGSMVADVHRTLFYGGVFIYPADKKSPTGKLRLLYEAAPMAFLMEQAGGKATTGKQAILDIIPSSIHQRVPVYMGSADDVADFEALAAKYL
ncbi:unnamed protein product [Agarophyton chilense]